MDAPRTRTCTSPVLLEVTISEPSMPITLTSNALALLLFGLVLATVGPSVQSARAATQPPHICIILVDDMGYGDPGCFNPESQIPTPNIDRLAAQGMRFTDAHAPGPLCHMSRYGLLTGVYPFRTDVSRWPSEPLIDANQITIATLARQAGYRTAMVGKWHLGFEERGYDQRLPGGPIDRGFDSFFGIRASTDIPPYFYIRADRAVAPPSEQIGANISDDWSPIQGAFWRAGGIAPGLELAEVLPRFTDEAIEVIERHADRAADDAKPLMLYLAYPSPHTPWLPASEFEGKSGAGLYGDFAMMVDAEIGRVLRALEKAGMARDTLLVFSSDNGPVWREADAEKFGHRSTAHLRGMKSDAWEGGHRMPMIVRWPDTVAAGSTSEQLVCFTDFLATFASIFGIDLPGDASVDSVSFLPALRGEPATDGNARQQFVMQAGSVPSTMLIRRGPWKLITQLGSGGFSKPKYIEPSPGGPAGQLYNLANDPAERHNLYEQRPEIVADLLKALKEAVGKDASTSSVPTTEELQIVDRSTLDQKVMCGYQGWFNCKGDGADLGWIHWGRSRRAFEPGTATVDLWPDVSEFAADERYETGFRHADGSVAEVFSSANRQTVQRHFDWMREYGIDGVFLQRFATELRHEGKLRHRNRVLDQVAKAAAQTGRSYALMYDLSGLPEGGTTIVRDDWLQLNANGRLTNTEAYQHHESKPIVAIWGIGFRDRDEPRRYTLQECRELVEFFKLQDCTVMLGVPTGWRQQVRDAIEDPQLLAVLELADILSPWTVGRYRNESHVARHVDEFWRPDRRWCDDHGMDYMPVVFPGFSWHNLRGGQLDAIPRNGGEFLWSQIIGTRRAGCEILYVAMFDEVDEGTAIFKCTNHPPVGPGVQFLTYQGLPSDFYLRLVGMAGQVYRREIPASRSMPSPSH